MIIQPSGKYNQMYRTLIRNQHELTGVVLEKVRLFRKNRKDTRLHNHPLKKRLSGKLAFSITDDVRIVYEWIGKNTVRFLAIGGHEKVYSTALFPTSLASPRKNFLMV